MLKSKIAIMVVCVAMLAGAAGTSYAHEYDRNDSDCPMRYAAYLLHPVGVALEWTITRPFHWLVMKPGFSYVFGHEPVPGEGPVWKKKEAPEKKSEAKPSAEVRKQKTLPAQPEKQQARTDDAKTGTAPTRS